MIGRKRVLFLCTGNSARSQMAEGLVNHFASEGWRAFSAGTAPTGYVHPLAVVAMGELGIDIAGQRSKSVNEFGDTNFDVVVTVCDEAAQNCPLWLGSGEVVHMGYPDPVAVPGGQEERLAAFRAVRDGLRKSVLAYLGHHREKNAMADVEGD